MGRSRRRRLQGAVWRAVGQHADRSGRVGGIRPLGFFESTIGAGAQVSARFFPAILVNVLTRHRVVVAAAMCVLVACTARAAETNGPMSSTKKPDAAAAAPATGTAAPADFDVEKLFAN